MVKASEPGKWNPGMASKPLPFQNKIPTVVFYCKQHEGAATEAARGGLGHPFFPKLMESYLGYLAYQRKALLAADTPESRQRLQLVDGLTTVVAEVLDASRHPEKYRKK
jgi:hypothetical protein